MFERRFDETTNNLDEKHPGKCVPSVGKGVSRRARSDESRLTNNIEHNVG